ncbi:MAG: hypothetical protein MH204_02195 [Fimbriimonadaceae bacterium]|nr:hypothetical protein [Fimbriimonadaceae bacterium]
MRENYLLHKLHSLTGIIPVGFYLCQHLTLNSFALAGPKAYDGVIHFFEGLPPQLLYALKYGVVWLPLIFHAVYGVIIATRADSNYSKAAYKFRENRYYVLQRWSGIVAFLFLVYHMTSTSIAASIKGVESTILYDNWAEKLSGGIGPIQIPFLVFAIYVVGLVASTYHFSYGIWNFCIRWGITISESAQNATAKVAQVAFVGLTALGILSLVGFFWSPLEKKGAPEGAEVRISTPITVAQR